MTTDATPNEEGPMRTRENERNMRRNLTDKFVRAHKPTGTSIVEFTDVVNGDYSRVFELSDDPSFEESPVAKLRIEAWNVH